MDDILGIILAIAMIGGIWYGIMKIIEVIGAARDIKKLNKELKQTQKQVKQANELEAQLSKAQTNLKEGLTNIISSYMLLSLTDDNIEAIINSDNPIAMLQHMIPQENPPDVLKFGDLMQMQWCMIMEEMDYPIEKAQSIYDYLMACVTSVTQEDVNTIAKEFDKHVHPQMKFLKGRINYQLACLGVMMGYAIEYKDTDLQARITNYRKQKGYIE